MLFNPWLAEKNDGFVALTTEFEQQWTQQTRWAFEHKFLASLSILITVTPPTHLVLFNFYVNTFKKRNSANIFTQSAHKMSKSFIWLENCGLTTPGILHKRLKNFQEILNWNLTKWFSFIIKSSFIYWYKSEQRHVSIKFILLGPNILVTCRYISNYANFYTSLVFLTHFIVQKTSLDWRKGIVSLIFFPQSSSYKVTSEIWT